MQTREEQKKDRFEDRVINVSRVSKTSKGGRTMSFSALVVVGDGQGTVGYGHGKAKEVPEAVKKAVAQAKKNLVSVPMEDETLPFAVEGRFGSSVVRMNPGKAGSGVVAGSAVRAIAELAGIPNMMGKIYGSRNSHNIVRATFDGLKQLMLREEYLKRRKG